MLETAFQYQDEIQRAYGKTVLQDKYKYVNNSNYWSYKLELCNDSWNSLEFVSISPQENYINGYFKAGISRVSEMVDYIVIMSFCDKPNATFAKDLYRFLHDLFFKYNFRKINFSVVIGNPIEKSYDKFIERHGGRVVGINKSDIRLHDGKYYDIKHYEIFREEYKK